MLNTCTIQGRLTADPEIKQGNQYQTARFTVASDRNFKDKNGNRNTDFIRCQVWGKRAETFAQHFGKGQRVIVEGSWQTGSYQDKNGNTVYTNTLNVNNFYFDDDRRNSNQQQSSQPQQEVDQVPF